MIDQINIYFKTIYLIPIKMSKPDFIDKNLSLKNNLHLDDKFSCSFITKFITMKTISMPENVFILNL